MGKTHELNSVHPLPSDMVGEITEKKLAKESTDGMSDFDSEVLVGRARSSVVIDIANHGGGNRDGKDIIAITQALESKFPSTAGHIRVGEEPDT